MLSVRGNFFMGNGWKLRLCSGGALTRRLSRSPFEEAAFLLWSCCLGCRFLISCELTKTCVWVATSAPTTPCAGVLPHAWPLTDLVDLKTWIVQGSIAWFSSSHSSLNIAAWMSGRGSLLVTPERPSVLGDLCWIRSVDSSTSVTCPV